MHALIDADIFTYSFGSCTDDFGHPLAWPLVATRLNAQIKNICDAVGASSYSLYITGKSNFRVELATIKPYKGSRPTDKPFWYQAIRDYLVKFRKARTIEGWEADDQLSIDQLENRGYTIDAYHNFSIPAPDEDHLRKHSTTIICSLDKDLNMVPGWHYNWTKDESYYMDPINGLRNFYSQLLTGDSVDNIPGLHGVGKNSAYVRRLQTIDSEYDMFDLVRSQYILRFGSYWWQFIIENAALLWMMQEEPECGQDPQDEIVKRLTELNNQTLGQSWRKRLVNSLSEQK